MKTLRQAIDWVVLAGVAFVLFLTLTAPPEIVAKTIQLCLFGALVLFCYKKRDSTLIPAWYSITGGKYVQPTRESSERPDVSGGPSDQTGVSGSSEDNRHEENQAAA